MWMGCGNFILITEHCFTNLKGPVTRLTTPHVPLPSADILEDNTIPSVDVIVREVIKKLKENSMEIIMPTLGETVDEGKVIKWLKNVGDEIKEGDILCEVETIRRPLKYHLL